MSNEQYQQGWLSTILDNFQSIMKKHDMPEDIAIELERFVVSTAREQFRAGSSGAIRYHYKQKALEAKAAKFAPKHQLHAA